LKLAQKRLRQERTEKTHTEIHNFHSSPKNKAELETVAAQASIRLNTIGQMLGTTRSAPSSARSVRAIRNNYPALYKYFHNASVGPNRTGREIEKKTERRKLCSKYGASVRCFNRT
jgi:hypothetical protein